MSTRFWIFRVKNRKKAFNGKISMEENKEVCYNTFIPASLSAVYILGRPVTPGGQEYEWTE